ncbi:hypothetical protein L6164_009539 [Bauhinia variegata]|uniref:Uncharacterized protein n=1 Tax=Bauhinia variegata TaxID=167791 RepID=A0ACB9PK17_BAUVA|nr:hypothetical protein L6164_009539 [Bauhinia variegata]
MNSVARRVSSLFRQSSWAIEPLNHGHHQLQQFQHCRGIRVKVINGNLEQALALMQRKMRSSGMERMIQQVQRHHVKNSEKRKLARKNLEFKIRSQEFCRKLKTILADKVRGL